MVVLGRHSRMGCGGSPAAVALAPDAAFTSNPMSFYLTGFATGCSPSYNDPITAN
jgi:hypothetical protein